MTDRCHIGKVSVIQRLYRAAVELLSIAKKNIALPFNFTFLLLGLTRRCKAILECLRYAFGALQFVVQCSRFFSPQHQRFALNPVHLGYASAMIAMLLLASAAQAGTITINFCSSDPNTQVNSPGTINWNQPEGTWLAGTPPITLVGTVGYWNGSAFYGYYIQNTTPAQFDSPPDNAALYPAGSLQYGGFFSYDGTGLGVSGIPAAWSSGGNTVLCEIYGGGYAHNRVDSVPTWSEVTILRAGETSMPANDHGYCNYAVRLTGPLVSLGMYWDHGAGTWPWATANNWDKAADGTGGDPAAAPGSTDVAFFNISTLNSAQTPTLAGNLSILGLVFNNTGTTAINTDGIANRSITLGAGLSINSGAGAVTFGTTVANQQISFTLGAAQPWMNYSTTTLALNNNNTIANGGFLLTFGGTGDITTGTGVISGTGGLTKTGAGTLTLGAANTYGGDTTISVGTLKLGAANVIPDGVSKGNVVMNPSSGTVTLNLNSYSETINGLSSSGVGSSVVDGTSDAPTLTVGANDQTCTFDGVMKNTAGTLALTKTGIGTLTLGGTSANTHGGLTTVSAGSLLLNKSGGAINAIANGGLTIASTASATAATVRYTGDSSDMMGTGALTINSNGHFDFNGKTDTIGNVAIVATGAGGATTPIINTAGGGNLTIGTLGITPLTGFLSTITSGTGTLTLGGNVTFTQVSTGQALISGTLDLNGATRTFTVGLGSGAGGYDLKVDAVISSAAGAITKAGAGRLTLSGNNSYGGINTLSAGILRAQANANALGLNASATALTLNVASTDLQLANDGSGLNFGRSATVSQSMKITTDTITGSSAGLTHTLNALSIGTFTLTVAGGANVTSGTAGLTFSGAVTLTGSPTFTVNNPASGGTTVLTLGGMAGGGSLRGITKAGQGTLVLNGAGASFAYSSVLLVIRGTVRQDVQDALMSTALFHVRVNGTTAGETVAYNLNNVNQRVLSLTFGGTASAASAVNNVATDTGTLTLGGTVTYTEATLDANDPGASTLSGKLNLGGATRTFSIADSTLTTSELTVSADISVTGVFGVTKTGAGRLILSGNNSYTGINTLSAGILRAQGNATTLGANATATALTLSGSGAELQLANDGIGLNFGRSATVSQSMQITTDTITGSSAGLTHTLNALSIGGITTTLTVAGGANVTSGTAGLTFSGTVTLTGAPTFVVNNPAGGGTTVLTLGGVVSGGFALTKSGAGTLVLSGNNNSTYSGGTTINAGTVRVTGQSSPNSGTGSGAVAVNAGGTLSGNGRISGVVTVADNATAVLYPNNTGGGTLTLGNNITFSGLNSGVKFDLSASSSSGNDKVILENKTLTCGSAQITIKSAGTLDTANYVLFDAGASGTISGGFNQIPAWSGTTPANSALYSIATIGKQVVLLYTPPIASGGTLYRIDLAQHPDSPLMMADGSTDSVTTGLDANFGSDGVNTWNRLYQYAAGGGADQWNPTYPVTFNLVSSLGVPGASIAFAKPATADGQGGGDNNLRAGYFDFVNTAFTINLGAGAAGATVKLAWYVLGTDNANTDAITVNSGSPATVVWRWGPANVAFQTVTADGSGQVTGTLHPPGMGQSQVDIPLAGMQIYVSPPLAAGLSACALSGASDISLSYSVLAGHTYQIWYTDTPGAAKIQLSAAGDIAANGSYVDAGAANATSTRVYQFKEKNGSFTGSEYGMLRQDRAASSWYLVAVPINYVGTANNLNSTFGTQLMRGMYGNSDKDLGDHLFVKNGSSWNEYWLYYDGSSTWQWRLYPNGGGAADLPVGPGDVIWVQRMGSAANKAGPPVFTGKTWINSDVSALTLTKNSWNVFGWPFPRTRSQVNLGAATVVDAFGFGASAKGGTTASLLTRYAANRGDELWVWTGTRWQQTWLMDGLGAAWDRKFWDQGTGTYGNINLEWGKGYYYYRRDTSDMSWTPASQ